MKVITARAVSSYTVCFNMYNVICGYKLRGYDKPMNEMGYKIAYKPNISF